MQVNTNWDFAIFDFRKSVLEKGVNPHHLWFGIAIFRIFFKCKALRKGDMFV